LIVILSPTTSIFAVSFAVASILIPSVIALKAKNGAESLDSVSKLDSSETIKTMFIEGIPDGLLIYTGESGSQVMAQNAGDDGSGNSTNAWSITLDGSGTPPKVWVKAPENWSGDVSNAKLVTYVEDGNSLQRVEANLNISIAAVASSVTIDPTKAIGDEQTWTDINLNANMTDLDGSETLILKLTAASGAEALEDSVTFPDSFEAGTNCSVSN